MLVFDAGAIAEAGRREVLPIRSRRYLFQSLQSLVLCFEDAVQLDFLPQVPAPILAQCGNSVVVGGKVALEGSAGDNFVSNDMQADLVAVANRLALLLVVLLPDMSFDQQGLWERSHAEQADGLAVHARPLFWIVVIRAATSVMRFETSRTREVAIAGAALTEAFFATLDVVDEGFQDREAGVIA